MMIATDTKRPFAWRVAIAVICAIALGICAISVLGIVQGLMRAYRFDAAFFAGFAYPVIIAVLAMAVFDGARKWRKWAIWPAVALFLLIVPINGKAVIDQIQNPLLPAGGFATEADLAQRDQNFMSAVLRPTEEEYWSNRRTVHAVVFLVLFIVTLPSGVLFYLRQRGALA